MRVKGLSTVGAAVCDAIQGLVKRGSRAAPQSTQLGWKAIDAVADGRVKSEPVRTERCCAGAPRIIEAVLDRGFVAHRCDWHEVRSPWTAGLGRVGAVAPAAVALVEVDRRCADSNPPYDSTRVHAHREAALAWK